MIIVIDGPSGSGKSTLAKMLAKELQLPYFDTGAMYRSFAWYLLKNHVDIKDESKIQSLLKQMKFEIKNERAELHYYVDGEDISSYIRTEEVSKCASKVSGYLFVRKHLVQIQQEYGKKYQGIFEGRDMGTVVFPNADLKFFLFADPKVRAQRRFDQLQLTYPQQHFELNTVLEELEKRDLEDTVRKHSPLKKADDAIYIDVTHLTLEQAFQKLKNSIESKIMNTKKNSYLFYRFSRKLVEIFFRLFYKMKVYGAKEHFISGGAIIAANHVSFFDPPFVGVAWPEVIHYFARPSLFTKPVLGWLLRSYNVHPLSAESAMGALKLISELLKQNLKVVIFPEGTRSTEDKIIEPKQGFCMIAQKNNSPIVPTYVHGAYDIWNKYRKLPKLCGRLVCIFGTPLTWDNFKHLEKKEAQAAMVKAWHQSVENLKRWYLDGAKGSPP